MENYMSLIEKTGYVPPEIAPYERNDPFGERLRMEAYSIGSKQLLIPSEFLQGTQTSDGYGSHKGKRAEQAIKTHGRQFLLKYPIIATAVFTNGDADIYVEDGHHRTIKAIKNNIFEIPTLLLTVDQMSEIRKRMGRKPDTPKEVGLQLIMESYEAQESLEKKGVKNFGKNIIGINNIEELTSRFSSFE